MRVPRFDRLEVDLRAIDKDSRLRVFLRDVHGGVQAIIGDTRKNYPLPCGEVKGPSGADADRAVARLARRFVPRICDTCPEPHVENCPLCFGWGISEKGSPISSHAAYRGLSGWKKCPVCGGEPVGGK